MTLPKSVIKQDHDLEQDYDTIGMQLMELRWHWTLDESNPNRETFASYGRQVGRDSSTIRVDARTWADKLVEDAAAANQGRSTLTNRSEKLTKTVTERRAKAKLGVDRHQAAEAIAKATGNAISTVIRTKNQEITAIVGRAQERAEKKGTSVEEEIERAAEWDAKAAATEKRLRDEAKKKHTSRFIEIEGDLGVAMQRLRKVLNVAEGVGFTDEEIELMTVSLGKLRALMNLIDLRIAGETNIDWDAEFQKIDK